MHAKLLCPLLLASAWPSRAWCGPLVANYNTHGAPVSCFCHTHPSMSCPVALSIRTALARAVFPLCSVVCPPPQCVVKCTEKFLKHSARVSLRFQELNQGAMEAIVRRSIQSLRRSLLACLSNVDMRCNELKNSWLCVARAGAGHCWATTSGEVTLFMLDYWRDG